MQLSSTFISFHVILLSVTWLDISEEISLFRMNIYQSISGIIEGYRFNTILIPLRNSIYVNSHHVKCFVTFKTETASLRIHILGSHDLWLGLHEEIMGCPSTVFPTRWLIADANQITNYDFQEYECVMMQFPFWTVRNTWHGGN